MKKTELKTFASSQLSSPENRQTKSNHSKTQKQKNKYLIQYKHSTALNSQNTNNALVICPNCQFHFKIAIHTAPSIKHHLHTTQNLQKTYKFSEDINRQYEELSRKHSTFNNAALWSPQKLTYKQQLQQQIRNRKIVPIQKLKKLNQISHLQKTLLTPQRSSSSSALKTQINSLVKQQYTLPVMRVAQTNNIQRSQARSKIEEKQQPRGNTQIFQQPKITAVQKSHSEFNLQNSKQITTLQQKTQSKINIKLIKSNIFQCYSLQSLLEQLLDWIKSTQQSSSLPTYLRLLISNYKAMKDSK